jgi:hypothetical protein
MTCEHNYLPVYLGPIPTFESTTTARRDLALISVPHRQSPQYLQNDEVSGSGLSTGLGKSNLSPSEVQNSHGYQTPLRHEVQPHWWGHDCQHSPCLRSDNASISDFTFDLEGLDFSILGLQHETPYQVLSLSKVQPRCWEHGCDGRTFSSAENLRRHVREQSGSNRVRCVHCSRTFTRKSNMKKHIWEGKCNAVKTYQQDVSWDGDVGTL